MRANTFKTKNGKLYLNENDPYIGENAAEKAAIHYASSILYMLEEIHAMLEELNECNRTATEG